jgi:hypothetical protein
MVFDAIIMNQDDLEWENETKQVGAHGRALHLGLAMRGIIFVNMVCSPSEINY